MLQICRFPICMKNMINIAFSFQNGCRIFIWQKFVIYDDVSLGWYFSCLAEAMSVSCRTVNIASPSGFFPAWRAFGFLSTQPLDHFFR